tara:strand:+ start:445 stop:621 length:177 start_codon:yes stop_codon:yes gene_type:complete
MEDLQDLIDKHQKLDDEADEMSARKFLIPSDRDKLKRIKFERLIIKDRIDRMRESISK